MTKTKLLKLIGDYGYLRDQAGWYAGKVYTAESQDESREYMVKSVKAFAEIGKEKSDLNDKNR